MKLIIFDIDGTLVYSNRLDSKAFAKTYENCYAKPFPTIDWSAYPHVTDSTIFKTVIQQHFNRLPSLTEETTFKQAFVQTIQQNRQQTPKAFKAVEGVHQAIDYLNTSSEYDLAIATGGWYHPALVKLTHVGIETTNIVISAADGQPTREDIINTALAQKLANYEKIVYVGDAAWDVKTTRNLKMNFIGIRLEGDTQTLLNMGATHVIRNYNSLDLFLDAVELCQPPKL